MTKSSVLLRLLWFIASIYNRRKCYIFSYRLVKIKMRFFPSVWAYGVMGFHFCTVRFFTFFTFFKTCLIYYHFLFIFINPSGTNIRRRLKEVREIGDYRLDSWNRCLSLGPSPFCYSHTQCAASQAQPAVASSSPTVKTSQSHKGCGICIGFLDLSAISAHS